MRSEDNKSSGVLRNNIRAFHYINLRLAAEAETDAMFVLQIASFEITAKRFERAEKAFTV